MLEQKIQEYAATKSFHPHTVQRWLSWEARDGASLLDIAMALKAGENHVRDLMDWLEEVAIRDGIVIADILEGEAIDRIKTDPRLGRADRLKRIKEQVRRLRFPRLSRLEDSISSRIRDLKLPKGVKVSVPTGLEGGDLRFDFAVSSPAQLRQVLGKLSAAAESQPLAEIFALINDAGVAEATRVSFEHGEV
jgi:hypothetical protein